MTPLKVQGTTRAPRRVPRGRSPWMLERFFWRRFCPFLWFFNCFCLVCRQTSFNSWHPWSHSTQTAYFRRCTQLLRLLPLLRPLLLSPAKMPLFSQNQASNNCSRSIPTAVQHRQVGEVFLLEEVLYRTVSALRYIYALAAHSVTVLWHIIILVHI